MKAALVLLFAALWGCNAASAPPASVVPSAVSIAHVGDATVICTTLGADALRDAGELQ